MSQIVYESLNDYLDKEIKVLNIDPEIYKKLTYKETEVLEDILSVNEDVNDIFSKVKKYAQKGALTLGILIALSGAVEAQNGNSSKVVKYALENAENKDKLKKNVVYSALVKLSTDAISKYTKEGHFDYVEAMTYLRKYYMMKRDNEETGKLLDEVRGVNIKDLHEKLLKVLDEMDWDSKFTASKIGATLEVTGKSRY